LSVGILESNKTELRAAIKAIEISASNSLLHHKHIIIESDSANIISWMNNLDLQSRDWLYICLGSITFIHSCRESNYMTDYLAKQEVRKTSEFVAWI
jgi:hypothetical protein